MCGADFLKILDVVDVMVLDVMEVGVYVMVMAGSQKIYEDQLG